ncbi:uncharacterized protein BHQ10_001112 [Talaromyces amestolkiae]|uniref:IPT/TIG domain-containing protein n=1 Tax=Talaromyces amestolkiae TaxID=1196081 RepID=A0A364KNH1_TALAM|nr:uncharacterized protein BHQ10_001112 [Talaromyces amestolkiae]RAO65100.1 hypothetical protein BHQ10_001112 [Talaromyces amestolkiae]
MAAAPTVSGINPTTGPTSGGTPLLIAGTNLSGATLVTFGSGTSSVTATPSSSTATTVSVTTPVWPFAPGTARVTVTTPGGSSTQPVFFNYQSITAPTLTSLSPNNGPVTGGNVTTITGTGLLNTTNVSFTQGTITVNAPSFAVLSSTQVAVVVPPAPVGAGPASVNVTNGAGTSATPLTYTYNIVRPLPVVTSAVPNTGPAAGGNSVSLTGTGFTFATQVNFGTTPALSFTVINDTSITAIAPPGSGTVTITVTGPTGTGTGVPYTYNPAPVPSITSLTPSSGPISGGNTVTITGTNLNTVTGITFGSVPATAFVILSPTAINITAPAGTAPGPVNLTVTSGTFVSPPVPYTYIALPAPTAIFPTAGVISGGTPAAITGTGLAGTTSVLFGSTPAIITGVVGDTEVDLIIPAHAVGTVPITVITPGGSDSSLSFGFQPPPVITSSSPTQGPTTGGTTVSINGAGLINATGVFFGGTPAASFNVVSDNLITAVSPPGTGAVSVTVNTPVAFSNGTLFQYVAPPTLTTINPTSGPRSGGNNVTLTGSGFTGTSNVFFGGLPASFVVLDDNTITAVAPPVGTAGPISVTVQNAGGTSPGITYTTT